MRLIDADALRTNALKATDLNDIAFDNCYPYWQFAKCIKQAPTIDAVPVVRGEWRVIGMRPVGTRLTHYCSVCDGHGSDDMNYCPMCGAQMEDKPCG